MTVLNCKKDQQKLNCIKKLHSSIIEKFLRFDLFITILLNCTVRNDDSSHFFLYVLINLILFR